MLNFKTELHKAVDMCVLLFKININDLLTSNVFQGYSTVLEKYVTSVFSWA